MSYYSFVKEEEKKLALQQKKHDIWLWTKIVGHKPEIQVLYDPHNLPKPQRRVKSEYISLAKAREIVRKELIQRQGAVELKDGCYRYSFTI